MAQWERVARFYNHISGLYPLINLGLKPYKKYLKCELDKLPTGLLLDIGTGHGAIFDLGLKHAITGLDISEAMLAKARKGHSKAHLVYSPSHVLPMEEHSFNYVVIAHVIGHMSNPQHGINEALRVLKPGGHLFILNHFSQPSWHGWPSKIFSSVSSLFTFSSNLGLEDILKIHPKIKTEILPADKWGNYKIIRMIKP